MASDVLGLFGAKSPQQLQQDYYSGLMTSPAQMGNQGLLQQLISTAGNAGAMMGYGAGRLLGGKVAGEVEAAYLDEAIKSASAIKGTPAEKMQAVAEYLANKPGMGAQAMKATEEANRLKAQDLQMQKAQQDLQPEFKNIKVPVETMEMGADGKMYPVRKSIEVTYKWNPQAKKYEPFEGDAQGAPKPTAPPPDVNPLDAEDERRKKLRAGGYGSSQPSAAPNVIESATAKAAEKINMAPLIAEANIERAGYNSAEQQVQAEEKKLRDMSSVQTLPPEIIKHFDIEDARRILRDQYAYLNDAQKRELRKRIAQGGMAERAPRRPPSAPKGDITGSRLL